MYVFLFDFFFCHVQMLVVQVQDSSFFPIPCGYRDEQTHSANCMRDQRIRAWTVGPTRMEGGNNLPDTGKEGVD